MIASAQTDVGKVRLENQDSFRTGEFPGGVFAVVCDGMGGAAGGSVASSVAAAVFAEEVERLCADGLPEGEAGDVMISAAAKANEVVYAKSQEDPALSGMGTTIVSAMITGGHLYIAHAGDSRAYLYSDGALKLLTKDHSVVQSLLDSGYITPEQAEHHVYKNLITRALGTEPEVPVDFNIYSIGEGEYVLLCTDGLTNYLKNAEIANIIKNNGIDGTAQILVRAANDNGGGDNVTAVVFGKQ